MLLPWDKQFLWEYKGKVSLARFITCLFLYGPAMLLLMADCVLVMNCKALLLN